jgi:hypothetical protein
MMGEFLASHTTAQLSGSAVVVIVGTLWSVLVFCVVAGLAAATLRAAGARRMSVRGVVGKVALLTVTIAGAINVRTELLNHPKWAGDTALSMAELVCILASPVLLVAWGVAATVGRIRERGNPARPVRTARAGR